MEFDYFSRIWRQKSQLYLRSRLSFCRITDDLIDKETSHREELLQSWKENVNRVIPNVADPVNLAWLYTRTKYKIPENYIYQLIDGVKMDIHKTLQ